jgi:hypothetical protein
MSYYNLCGIGSQHSNISKGKGGTYKNPWYARLPIVKVDRNKTVTLISQSRAPTTFKLEGEVTSHSESSQGEVGDNREKWGDFWEKLIVINRNIVS